jgi:uncharacterized membrane protein
MEEALIKICRLVCRTRPERYFSAGDFQSLLCVRCTGLYLGILLAVAVVLSIRDFEAAYRRWAPWAGAAIFLPFLDVGLVLLGVWEGANFCRFLTGLCAGAGIGFITTPLFLKGIPPLRPGAGARVEGRLRAGRLALGAVGFIGAANFLPVQPLLWAGALACLAALVGEAAMVTFVVADRTLRRVGLGIPWPWLLAASVSLAPVEVYLLHAIPGTLRDPGAWARTAGL